MRNATRRPLNSAFGGGGTSCRNTRYASSRAGSASRRRPMRTIWEAPGLSVKIGGVARISRVAV